MPDHVIHDPQDRAALARFLKGRSPPAWAAAFTRGEETVSERVAAVRADFGNDRAELEFPDGRHVTVDIPRELVSLAEVRE